MDTIDIILLGGLCSLIGAGYLFRHLIAVRLSVVTILVCIGFGSFICLSMFSPRLIVNRYERLEGKPTKDIEEGVRFAMKVAGVYAPYALLSMAGLALMAVLNPRKTRSDE